MWSSEAVSLMTAQAANSEAIVELDRSRTVPILSTFDKKETFGQSLARAIQPVVEAQQAAETAVAQFARGEEGEIHQTMMQLSRADISLRLFVTTRNKCLEAFKEVLHMGG